MRIYKYVTRIFQKRERDLRSADGFSELNVPVREIKEVFPAVVVRHSKINLDERTPLGTFGLSNQMHAGFARGAVRFFGVTRDAGANDILPGRRTPAIARNDVVEIEVLSVASASAVLTSILVAFEDIMPGELHLFLRHVFVNQEQNHPGNANTKRNGADRFRMRFLLRNVLPLVEIVGLEGAVLPIEHNLGMTLDQQRKCATCGAHVHCLPEPVQYQHMLVKDTAHCLPQLGGKLHNA